MKIIFELSYDPVEMKVRQDLNWIEIITDVWEERHINYVFEHI